MPILPHELPRQKRLDYIDRIFIRHPDILLADEALRHLTDDPARRREATIGYIRGYSRCGKSETLKRHIEEITGSRVAKGLEQLIRGKDGRLVIYVELSAGETPLGVATRILGLFEDLRLKRGGRWDPPLRERDAIQRCVDIANDNGVALLALDEFQNLFRTGTEASIAAAGSMLITMQNAAAFPIAVTGSPMLEELFAEYEAVEQRAGPRTLLRPLPFKSTGERDAFGKIIRAFEGQLPFLEGPGMFTEEWLPSTFFATRGRLGRLTKLMRAATTAAFAGGKGGQPPSVLTIGHLRRGFALLHRDDPAMLGLDPWDRTFKLPDIPLSIEDAQRITLRTRPRRKGRRLIDE